MTIHREREKESNRETGELNVHAFVYHHFLKSITTSQARANIAHIKREIDHRRPKCVDVHHSATWLSERQRTEYGATD